MCGIAGIFGDGAIEHKETVRRMAASMRHRGPDGQGVYVSPTGRCVLGHCRLSILDLSDSAAQPMLSADRSHALVYNGECYNFQEIRNEFHKCGETFLSSGDTEVILKLLVREGNSALSKINGMFALALWDDRNQELVLARDRYGQKPLYVFRSGKLTLFASEVRSLLASGLVPRKADPDAIRGYLAYGAVQEPYSIVSGVSILRPGSYMTLQVDGKGKTDCYWECPSNGKAVAPDELREKFCSAVKRHLVSDVPLGLFLSGGIDSSAVTAAATRSANAEIKTLSVVFPDQPSQSEAKYASQMASLSGTEHCEIPITGQDLLGLLPNALDAMDQPTGDAINTYIVSRAASQAGLTVALSGLGSDELFGGYPSFSDVPKMLRIRRLLGWCNGCGANLLQHFGLFSIKLSKMMEMLDAPADIVNSYLVRRRVFSSRQIKRIAPGLAGEGWDHGLNENYMSQLHSMVKSLEIHDAVGLLEMQAYMGQMLLRDSDVMGMAHSLEIRLPFLDTDFSSFVLGLAPETRIPRRQPKWLFTEAMGEWLPREISGRDKWGFTLPFKNWMLRELKKEVLDGILNLPRVCSEMKQDVLLKLWEQFCVQPEKIGWFRLWSLFVLGRYLEKHRLEVSA